VQVDARGEGLIDAEAVLGLMKPVLGVDAYKALEGQAAGRRFVRFEDLATPNFTVAFDTAQLQVNAKVLLSATSETAVSVQASEVPDPRRFDRIAGFSAGANVSLSQIYDEHAGLQPLFASIDMLAHVGGFPGLTFTSGLDYDGAQRDHWVRRDTRLTMDFFDSAVRLSVGEFTPPVESFQGAARILGIGVNRDYDTIRPFQNWRPAGRQSFTLDRDSAVDVYVNGLKTSTLRLQPGRYSITDFPFATGANQVRLVVEDPGGQREVAVFDLFDAQELLRGGISDWGFSVGKSEGSASYQYDGPVAATGYYKLGLSDALTLGVNGQIVGDQSEWGALAALGTRFGLMQFEASLSHGRLGDGGALAAFYRNEFSVLRHEDFRVTASALYRSPEFRNAFVGPVASAPVPLQLGLQTEFRGLNPYDFILGLSYQKGRGAIADVRRVDMGVSRSFFGRLTAALNVSVGDAVGGVGRDTRVTAGVSMPFGSRYQATSRYDSGTERFEAGFSRTEENKLNDVSGELLVASEHDGQELAGRIHYINNRFDAEVIHNRLVSDSPDSTATRAESQWRASTFVGFADGSFGIGRFANEAFVIAPVHASLAGSKVELTSGGDVIAQSGWFGPPVAPIARSYGVSNFGVNVNPLPEGYDLAGVISVFPSYGAGYRYQIGSDASRVAVGLLIGDDGPMALVGGSVEPVGGKPGATPRPFFTNRGGRFVADGLAPGKYRLVVGGRPVGEFQVPSDKQGLIDVGKICATRC
jgi:outer membrane usher protein